MEKNSEQMMYFPDYIQKELYGILDDIFDFAIHRFRRTLIHKTERAIAQLNIAKEMENDVFSQLIYWAAFCSPIGMENMTIYQHYLFRNKTKMRKKPAQIQKVLVKWLFLNPGFYLVERDNSLSGRVFVFRDIFNNRLKLVCIFHTHYQQLERGDLVSGLMMPMGDDSYSALRGFIKVPASLTTPVTSQIVPHFKKHASSINYQANPQLFPSLLHIMLKQMEAGKRFNESK